MRKLDGCDDRALVLENHHLSALRWGAEENRYALSELTPGSVARHDKGKLFGVFGKEERVRTEFAIRTLAIWVPLERQAEAGGVRGRGQRRDHARGGQLTRTSASARGCVVATSSALRWSLRITHSRANSGSLPNSIWRAISSRRRVSSS